MTKRSEIVGIVISSLPFEYQHILTVFKCGLSALKPRKGIHIQCQSAYMKVLSEHVFNLLVLYFLGRGSDENEI